MLADGTSSQALRRPAGAMRRDDSGAAAVEFATVGVLLLIPLVYLVITMGRIQAGSLAASAAARAAVRSLTTAPTEPQGRARAEVAARLALADQGVGPGDARLTLTCHGSPCLSPGAQTEAEVVVRVGLPGVPGFVRGVIPLHVTVRASSVAVVDRFRTAAPR